MADLHSSPPGNPIAIHFGRSGSVTACGRARVPVTPEWPRVTCWTCLWHCPPAPWLEARRAEVHGRFREWLSSPRDPTTPVELCVRCAARTGGAGWACVSCARPLCRDCGDREPSACGSCD